MLHVKFSGVLRRIAGCSETKVALPESRRLDDVLAALELSYPGILGGSAELQWRHGSSYVMVAVNGKLFDDGNEDWQLAHGDHIELVPPVGGG